MKKWMILASFILAFAADALAQYPANYEIICPSGSVPISGPSGTSFNPSTGKYKADTCIDPFGNITINSQSINVFSWSGQPVIDGQHYPFTDAGLNAAIASLGGASGEILIPPGTLNTSASITSLTDNQHIECSAIKATTIQYVGTSNIAAIFDIGTPGQTTIQHNGISINNCTISGNSHVQYAIRTTAIHRSDFSHNNLINVTTAGFNSNFAVILQLDDLHTSVSEQAFTQQPASCIILDGPDVSHKTTSTSVAQPKCEGVSGTGIVLNNTATVTVKGGTSEQNNKGITLGTGSLGDIIDGVDMELNTTSNIEDNGFQNVFRNETGNGKYLILGSANLGYWTGMALDTITISPGANFNTLDGIAYNNSGSGTFTDSGTNTVRRYVVKTGTGLQYGDEYGTCTFAASTTCAITFTPSWVSAPVVFITPINPGAVTFTINSAPTTSGFTITASASNSLVVNWSASLH